MNTSADPSTTGSCDCDNCRGGDLPANPFLAPRIAYGMLLGEDDFSTLIGYPRGKHLLHQAWLHGSGVVWGYEVCAPGLYDLEVGRGLALDPLGRELLHSRCRTIDLSAYVETWVKDGTIPAAGGKHVTLPVRACVVATFDGCLSDPVPTTADPCDITRTHDDYSRVVEQTRIEIRYGSCPERLHGVYPRVRMLLGVAPLTATPAGRDVREAREAVLEAADRAGELERQLWIMACRDGLERRPAVEGSDADSWLPVPVEDAAVVLAELSFTLTARDEHWTFAKEPVVEECVRTTLLPTDVLTALTAGLAPGVLGTGSSAEEGPRVEASKLEFEEKRQTLVIPVTAPLVPGTVPGNVELTTLSQVGYDQWVVEDLSATYDAGRQAIVAKLASSLDIRPADALVRIRVAGTGARPVMGVDPLLPLAGVVGRPSGDPLDGRDAVWTFTNEPSTGAPDTTTPNTGVSEEEESA